jgi:putative transposase
MPAAAVRFVPRAMISAEREAVLACLHEERFQNCAPAAIYATLLDEGRYHCKLQSWFGPVASNSGLVDHWRSRMQTLSGDKPGYASAYVVNGCTNWSRRSLASPSPARIRYIVRIEQ